MPDSVAALQKLFRGCGAIQEKSDGMLLPGAGFVNDFRHDFLGGPFISRKGKLRVAECQKICNVFARHRRISFGGRRGRNPFRGPANVRMKQGSKRQRAVMASANILLVDDEEDFRFIFTRQVTRILQDLQLEFFEAGDGEEALELLRTGVKPSIIILDYTMPRMSGTELLKTIDREHGDLVNVPRLVLSGYIGEDAIREVKSLRCDYMEKSMNTKIFYQRFCRYLTDKLGLPPAEPER